jgi:hypothetical protein
LLHVLAYEPLNKAEVPEQIWRFPVSRNASWLASNSSDNGSNVIMAQADKKHFGKGSQGKGSGAGAMSEADGTTVGDNQVLSNRDKKQHSKERGQDGNAIKTDQQQDHAANRRP